MSLGRRVGIVTATSIAANLAALAKNAAVAARFGVGSGADLIGYGETLLLFLPTLLLLREAYGIFISVYGETLETEGRREQAALAGAGLAIAAAAGLALTILLIAAPSIWMRLAAPGLAPDLLRDGSALLLRIGPALLFQEVAEFSRGIHNAHHRYAVPGVVLILGNIVQTGILLALPQAEAMTAWIVALDVAAFLQAAILVATLPVRPRLGLTRANLFPPGIRAVVRLVLPVAAGVILVQIAGYLERAVLSFMPSGSLATLQYSRKLLQPLQTILAASIALPVYVQMARSADARVGVFTKGALIHSFLFLPMTGYVMLAAPDLVLLAFQRGLFAGSDTAAVTLLVRIGVFGILPAALLMSLRDLFYASRDTRPLVWGGGIQLAVTAASNLLLVPRFGIVMIPAGVVLGMAVSCGVLLAIARRRVVESFLRRLVDSAWRSLAGTACALGAGILVLRFLPGAPDAAQALMRLAATGIAGAAAFAVATYLMRHPVTVGLLERTHGAR